MIEKISIVHNSINTDITSYKSLSVIREVNGETNIMPGCATAAMLRVNIWGESGNIVSTGDTVKYYQSEDDGTTWTLKGLFYAQKPSQVTRNSFGLIAYDAITKLDVDLTEWLSDESNFSSISNIGDLITAVGTQCGITINTTGIDNTILSAPVGWLGKTSLTGRQIIAAIAQIACKFVTADINGNINFGWYTSGAVGIEPSGDNSTTVSYKQDGLTATDYETETVTGIALVNSDTNVKIIYPTNATGNIVSITNNVVLNVISDVSVLTDIATVLYNGFTALPNFKPTNIQMFRNSLINVGTSVNVTDGNGNTFATLITKTELSSSGLFASSESEENYTNFSATALDNSGNVTTTVFNQRLNQTQSSISSLSQGQNLLNNRLNGVESTANSAQSTANAANTAATNAQSTATSAQSTANSASTTATAAQQATTVLNQRLNQAEQSLEDVEDLATTAKSTADTAKSTADTAKSTAESASAAASSAQTTATTANTTANTAAANASTALTNAEAAQYQAGQAATTANQANSTAIAADEKADEAKGLANTANTNANLALTQISGLEEQIDGKIETYSQNTDPSTSWTTTADKTKHTGDLWYNTSTKETKRWSGTAWVTLASGEAEAAMTLAQTKAQVFTAQPTIPYYKGDIWITSLTTGGVVKICETGRTTGSYSSSDWVASLKYTDDTLANTANTNATAAQSTANEALGKINGLKNNLIYKTQVEIGQGVYATYYHNKDNIEDSDYILYLNPSRGIGVAHSYNDGNPVFEYGVTAEGEAILKDIYAQTINADYITAGVLSSRNGNVKFDLDEGDLVSYENVETDSESIEEKTTLDSGSIKFARDYTYHGVGFEDNYNCQIYIGTRHGVAHRGIELVVNDAGYVGSSVIPTIETVYSSTGVVSQLNMYGLEVSKLDDEGGNRSSGIYADGALIGGDLELNGNITGSYDSGWQEIALSNSDFELSDSTRKIKFRKIGKVVYVAGRIRTTTATPTATASGYYELFTLNSNYCPHEIVYMACPSTGGKFWSISVTTGGVVRLANFSGTIQEGTEARFNISFLVD